MEGDPKVLITNPHPITNIILTLSPGFGSLSLLLNWVILLLVCSRLHALVYGDTNCSCGDDDGEDNMLL